MPRVAGTYSLPAGSTATPNTTIESAKYNAALTDIADALTDSINKDGTKAFAADQSMGSNKLTNLAAGAAAADAPRTDQVQTGIVSHATVVGGTVDAITLTYAPAFTAYTNRMKIRWTSAGANTVVAPTVNVSGLGTKTVKKGASAALIAGDLGASGYVCEAVYNGTDFILLNPASTVGASLASTTEVLQGTNAAKLVTPDALAALHEWGGNNTGGATITIGEGGFHDLITSTTTITAFNITTDNGMRTFRVRFNTVRTLTHSSTLKLPGQLDIVTAAGDMAQFSSNGGGGTSVTCDWYRRTDGKVLIGALTLGTTDTTTGGTSIDRANIPSWVNRITIMFRGVSTSGSSNVQIQIGDSGGIETSGYVSTVTDESAAAGNSTTGFIVVLSGASDSLSGVVTLYHMGGNVWVSSGNLKSSTSKMYQSAGDKALSDVLTQLRITTVGGANTFDANNTNIMYE